MQEKIFVLNCNLNLKMRPWPQTIITLKLWGLGKTSKWQKCPNQYSLTYNCFEYKAVCNWILHCQRTLFKYFFYLVKQDRKLCWRSQRFKLISVDVCLLFLTSSHLWNSNLKSYRKQDKWFNVHLQSPCTQKHHILLHILTWS